MAAVYQDEATRAWACQTVAEAASLVGEDAVRCQWWDMHQLSDPLVGAEAFRGAEPADMLIVAIRAVERLPVAFYAWISSGLGHRSRRDGLLVALLAASKRPCALRKVLRRYLEGLARSNHLDFLACEQNLAASIP